MDEALLLLKRASALIEAYQACYEGRGPDAEEKGSFLIECAGESVNEALLLLFGGEY